jgi:single-stranded-DNA-specific exonuclease
MAKRWRIHAFDRAAVARLEASAGVSSVVAQLLLSRGISDPQQAAAFLDVKLSGLRDPGELPGAAEAAERIASAVGAGRRIVIYGDYDADGMTGAAVLVLCLRMLGANVGYHVPNRLDEGYGLHDEALEKLAREGAQLVVSVDCGIASVAQALTARRLGLELIITDHHELAESLPEADVLVHPRLPGCSYPFGGLSGSGVALKLAWAICQQVSSARKVPERMRNFLLQAVGLASIGTVADVVPLVDENRILVRHGLNSLKAWPTPGVAAMMRLTELDKKPALSSEDIAFTLAPRLNAAGRLGQAQLGVELLITDSDERATALAEYLHELNGSRSSLERSVYLAANKQAQEEFDPEGDAALVLAGVGWHAGVIGIVAGRLAEKFFRPVVLISLDQVGVKPGVGSARSIPGFALHEALAHCTEHLLGHGGHAAAAGLQIEESKLDAFRAEFCEYAASEITSATLVEELRIDGEAPFSALTHGAVQQIESLAPFGAGNRRPILCTSEVRLAEPPKRIGGGERHLSLRLEQHGVKLRAVAFGKGDWADELAQVDGPLSVAFQPVINHFRGAHRVELHLTDWCAGSPEPVSG